MLLTINERTGQISVHKYEKQEACIVIIHRKEKKKGKLVNGVLIMPIFFERMNILLKKLYMLKKNDLCMVLTTVDGVYKKTHR